MAQQINLCTPILLTQKRYFSALAMVQALGLFALVGGGLGAYGWWSLKSATDGFKKTLALHTVEMAGLNAALQAGRAGSRPVDASLTRELETRRGDDGRRSKVLDELRRGLVQDGRSHSVRLQLVAQTIPVQAWVTDIKADDSRIEISGFTLEPAVLNEWVRALAARPVLQGQILATLKVDRVAGDAGTSPRWAFSLVSAVASPEVLNDGGKP